MIKKIEILKLDIKNNGRQSGFTLVEIIIAVTLFSLVVFISLGALITIFDANRRAQATRTVIDNLNFALEDMTRTVRFGSDYHCGISGTITDPRDCPSGDTLFATNFEGATIVYALCGNAIKRSDNGDTNCSSNNMKAITSPETIIDHLRFYSFGSESVTDTNQPYVVAVIRGYVGNKPTTQSVFSIQTLMSRRTLDI